MGTAAKRVTVQRVTSALLLPQATLLIVPFRLSFFIFPPLNFFMSAVCQTSRRPGTSERKNPPRWNRTSGGAGCRGDAAYVLMRPFPPLWCHDDDDDDDEELKASGPKGADGVLWNLWFN